jgi:hypothetical protein
MDARYTRTFVNDTTRADGYFMTTKLIVFEYKMEPFTEIVIAALPTGADFGILNFFTTMPELPILDRYVTGLPDLY